MAGQVRLGLVLAAVTLIGCGQPATPKPGSAPEAQPAPSAKTLVAALKVEPATIALRPPQEASGVGLYLSDRMFNATLALLDWRGLPMPYLAESLPQLNTDDWRVLSDGRMETTFHLRPNLVWHDGAPLGAEDFVFAWQVYARPDLGLARRLPMDLIES